MIAQEQDRPIIVSKVKYLGSCLLPSPIELEATIVLYYNRMHIPELDATIPLDTVSQIELAKGKDLPSQTIMMLGVVGVVVEKENPYMTIKIVNSPDSLLFKFGNMILADKLVKEIKAAKDLN
jgi:maltose-binding protein MalE